ncbi:MAG: CCA tRNA nucleotidyltransferase [Holophagales bacterium]|nr:CCA tRNA nucleotidyltransferase [Holophagales bacterium]MBK9967789.1 CCA tRNA nucleotidyltransferase [Holophagales bacterium]
MRDLLLVRQPIDVDIAVEGPVLSVAVVVSALAAETGWGVEALHERFGTARLRGPDGTRIDVAATREEEYPHPGALPVVKTGVPILQDLGRRDFTVHAMAFRLSDAGIGPSLIDPFLGENDLRLRRLRLLHDGSLADDPTRVFRAARYAARLGFETDPGFQEALRRGVASGAFERISGDRLRRALQETLSEENRGMAVEILGRLGIFAVLVEGWEVPDAVARKLSEARGPEEAWTSLLSSVPPSLRERIAARLNFSRAFRRATGFPR